MVSPVLFVLNLMNVKKDAVLELLKESTLGSGFIWQQEPIFICFESDVCYENILL
jgi:hypothetical protein